MPLLDHFHPPLSSERHWQGFHIAWAAAIADELNEELPPRFFAEPHVRWGSQPQVDVGMFEQDPRTGSKPWGGVATAVWAPAAPALVAPVDFAALDDVEVRVFSDEEGPGLVAAIELVSPANKDRGRHPKAFAIKCAGYLQQSVSVVLVDIVTTRSANLLRDLLDLLEIAPPALPSISLYAAACRFAADDRGGQAGGVDRAARPGRRPAGAAAVAFR